MGNLINGLNGFRYGLAGSDDESEYLADLRRVYGTTKPTKGSPIIRIAMPWHRDYWENGWPAPSQPCNDKRVRMMSMRMNPERYMLGTIVQNLGQKDFSWEVNSQVLTENILDEWKGRCRSELDATLTVERILRENCFKLLEEKHLLLG